jgi:hypothetical protein
VHRNACDEAREGQNFSRNGVFYHFIEFLFQDEGAETDLKDKYGNHLRHHVQHILF